MVCNQRSSHCVHLSCANRYAHPARHKTLVLSDNSATSSTQLPTALPDIMHFSPTVLTALLASTATAAARDVPANVRSFYNKVKNQDRCPSELQGGFHSRDNDNKGMYLLSISSTTPSRVQHCVDQTRLISVRILQRPHFRRDIPTRQRQTTRQHGH